MGIEMTTRKKDDISDVELDRFYSEARRVIGSANEGTRRLDRKAIAKLIARRAAGGKPPAKAVAYIDDIRDRTKKLMRAGHAPQQLTDMEAGAMGVLAAMGFTIEHEPEEE
jgi:hypothetical protein